MRLSAAASATRFSAAPSSAQTLEAESRFGLARLCSLLSLTPFERHLILLCAAAEIDQRFPPLLAELNGPPSATAVTFALAFSTWGDQALEALAPDAALRQWGLIGFADTSSLLHTPLSLDERILFFLTGVATKDGRLFDALAPLPKAKGLSASQQALADDLAGLWHNNGEQRTTGLVQVFGARPSERRGVISVAGEKVGRPVHSIRLAPVARLVSRDSMGILLEREALLSGGILFVETEGDEALWEELRANLTRIGCDLVIASRRPLSIPNRPCRRFELERDDFSDMRTRFRDAFGAVSPQMAESIDRVATQFFLDPDDIETVRQTVNGRAQNARDDDSQGLLWNLCRRQARRSLDGLAQRVVSRATWNDLVLPEQKLAVLRDMVAQVAQRSRVYGDWGFAAKCSRGLGITALFSGESGTGKTLAAEVIANQLGLDLYRIDLSQVVSKYIGETEKNLRQVFDAADECGAVLLFDEADALFGRRSEVKDSHDRYANIEVSYLLQRMEAYRGLAILTSNRKSALDTAFTRRLRFMIDFPFPDAQQRAAIWRRAFPEGTPTAYLSPDRLGRITVTGGQIANIALLAAFMAAGERTSVTNWHIARATRYEFAKTDKPFTDLDLERSS
jgi:hypothetical protein